MEVLAVYFILFFLYSFMGWLLEVIKVAITEKKFINRGFLIGPYCPIYGTAAIIMILCLNNYKISPLSIFIHSLIISSLIEYLISYGMEKIFNARWWDYSHKKFNINGRICLTNALAFGFLGLLLIYIINPLFSSLLAKINPLILNIISIILLIIFLTDFTISMNISCKIKNTIKKFKKDNTEEINKKVKAILENKILNRRIFKAFPKLKINYLKEKIINTKNIIENKLEKKR